MLLEVKKVHIDKARGSSKPYMPGSSFVWGGFECTYALNKSKRLDILALTRHDVLCREDYRLLKEMGITTVREGLSSSEIHKEQGLYDFSRFEKMMRIAAEEGIKIVWDLNHFNFPEWLDPFSEEFALAFTEYAVQALRTIAKHSKGEIWVVPWNEPSFFSWIAGEEGVWAPFGNKRGGELKYKIIQAVISAMKAMREENSQVRFMHTDPIMYRKARFGDKISQESVNFFNEIRFHSWDMLSGRMNPELGGDPGFIDAIGVNFYIQNEQWEWRNPKNPDEIRRISIHFRNPKFVPFSSLLQEIFLRYGKPIVIAETGSFGAKRATWWGYVLGQIEIARTKLCLPIWGVCAYPVIDDPNWYTGKLNNSGLWDFETDDKSCRRIPHKQTLRIVGKYIQKTK